MMPTTCFIAAPRGTEDVFHGGGVITFFICDALATKALLPTFSRRVDPTKRIQGQLAVPAWISSRRLTIGYQVEHRKRDLHRLQILENVVRTHSLRPVHDHDSGAYPALPFGICSSGGMGVADIGLQPFCAYRYLLAPLVAVKLRAVTLVRPAVFWPFCCVQVDVECPDERAKKKQRVVGLRFVFGGCTYS